MTFAHVHWRHATFDELTSREVYEILKLRSDVFVVEQNCVYGDIDRLDYDAIHLFAQRTDRQNVVAYCRVFEPKIVFEEASIGRVVTAGEVRGQSFGRQLCQQAVEYCDQHFTAATEGFCGIRIAAQAYLQAFYADFGFQICGAEYLEDGIPHIPMLRGTRPSN